MLISLAVCPIQIVVPENVWSQGGLPNVAQWARTKVLLAEDNRGYAGSHTRNRQGQNHGSKFHFQSSVRLTSYDSDVTMGCEPPSSGYGYIRPERKVAGGRFEAYLAYTPVGWNYSRDLSPFSSASIFALRTVQSFRASSSVACSPVIIPLWASLRASLTRTFSGSSPSPLPSLSIGPILKPSFSDGCTILRLGRCFGGTQGLSS